MKDPSNNRVIVALFEDSQSDVLSARTMIEDLETAEEAWKPYPWMTGLQAELHWLAEEESLTSGVVPAAKALEGLFSSGASVLLLDLNLGGKKHDEFFRELDERFPTGEDKEQFWGGEVRPERDGGFWVLRELERLRSAGVPVPLVAVWTQFESIVGTGILRGAWWDFLLNHGAYMIVRKPLSRKATATLLKSARFHRACMEGTVFGELTSTIRKAVEGRTAWRDNETALVRLLDCVVKATGAAPSKKAFAKIMGVSESTLNKYLTNNA